MTSIPHTLGTAEDSSPLVRIRSLLPGLARAEQRVAHVVLDDPASVAHRSITEVADSAGTSETTVTRFCKAIGVGGYPELRLALAAATAGPSAVRERELGGEIEDADDLTTVAHKVAFADARAIEETVDQLDMSALGRVVDVLSSARHVGLYGVGASAFVAADLQHKLTRIGRMALSWSDPHAALTGSAVLGPGDVAMGISHTGSTTDTIDFLTEAGRHGATTVALTNYPRSAITEVSEHVITTAARETSFRTGAMASRIAALTVLDSIYVGVARRLTDVSVAALAAGEEAVRGRRLLGRPDGRRKPLRSL
ncbi:MAG TPA: MurR/RpiR family transcriptional regulator [Pseudonocardiaceae bacterium]